MEEKTEYIEIAKFKLNPGFSDEQFLEAELEVRSGEIKSTRGYLGRELFKAENNEWVVILRFDSQNNMEAFLAVLKQERPESLKKYASAIDFSSMRMEFFHKIL